jgi:hypothetical protein
LLKQSPVRKKIGDPIPTHENSFGFNGACLSHIGPIAGMKKFLTALNG